MENRSLDKNASLSGFKAEPGVTDKIHIYSQSASVQGAYVQKYTILFKEKNSALCYENLRQRKTGHASSRES